MAGPYGDTARIKDLLGLADAEDPAIDTRLESLNEAVSDLAEAKLGGLTFGAVSGDVGVLHWGYNHPTLVLDRPLRSVTSITVGGTVAGGVMTGGTALPTSQWTPTILDEEGAFRGITLLSGGWWGSGMPVLVTGQWADQDADAEPPKDFVAAVEQVIADHFRLEQGSVAGLLGPEGLIEPAADPWANPLWQAVEERYTVSSERVVI